MKKKIRRFFARLLVRILILATRIFPRKRGLGLFSRIGSLAFRLFRRERETAVRNISLAFPGMDEMIVHAMAKGSFSALGRNVFDALRLSYIGGEEVISLCRIEGEEHLREAYEERNGVIAVTGHIGCWELLAAYVSRKGYRLTVIAKELPDRVLDGWLRKLRERHGFTVITRGRSGVSAVRALARGDVLGVLIDQDMEGEGVFVPFFGVPAHTTVGASVLSLRTGAPIVPMAIHMLPDGTHRIMVLPPIEEPPDELDEDERVRILTERSSLALEKLIRLYPQQWVWFHDRWKKAYEMNMVRDPVEGEVVVKGNAMS